MENKILVVIPARGGSKGLPGKNIKELCGKPLICWTIDVAREIVKDENICVSTDYSSIAAIVRDYGLNVPFIRPDVLSSDSATTRDVIIHALNFYEKQGKCYDIVVLLQPTSPLRTSVHVREALDLYTNQIDMVVSVKKSHTAAVLAQDNHEGYLELVLNQDAKRRQDIPIYYEYNGAIYIINVQSLRNNPTMNYKRKIKYIMDDKSSLDIDNQLDFDIVELIKKNQVL